MIGYQYVLLVGLLLRYVKITNFIFIFIFIFVSLFCHSISICYVFVFVFVYLNSNLLLLNVVVLVSPIKLILNLSMQILVLLLIHNHVLLEYVLHIQLHHGSLQQQIQILFNYFQFMLLLHGFKCHHYLLLNMFHQHHHYYLIFQKICYIHFIYQPVLIWLRFHG